MFCVSAPILSLSPAWYLIVLVSYSFYTFSRLPEVKEVVVVCDPSYQDIFEGMKPLMCSSDGTYISAPIVFISIMNFVLVAFQTKWLTLDRCQSEDPSGLEICFARKGEARFCI